MTRRTKRTLGLAALIIALSAASIRAGEITVEKIGPNTFIKIFGKINLGDDIAFADKTKTITNPAGVLIWLGSPGGILGPALEIATMVRDRGYSTVVSRYGGPCASACPLIWFSGQHAIIQLARRERRKRRKHCWHGHKMRSGCDLVDALVG